MTDSMQLTRADVDVWRSVAVARGQTAIVMDLVEVGKAIALFDRLEAIDRDCRRLALTDPRYDLAEYVDSCRKLFRDWCDVASIVLRYAMAEEYSGHPVADLDDLARRVARAQVLTDMPWKVPPDWTGPANEDTLRAEAMPKPEGVSDETWALVRPSIVKHATTLRRLA